MAFTFYHEPNTISEASRLLIEHGKKAACLAGGTSLQHRRDGNIEHLVSLKKLELNRLEDNVIGATVTLTELVEQESESKAMGLLQKAAGVSASDLLRNQITVGGSALVGFRWSDLAAPLLAMDAHFELTSSEGKRSVSASEFLDKTVPQRFLADGEILKQIVLPNDIVRAEFTKFGMSHFCHAIWDLVVLQRNDEHIVALSAGTPFPTRLQSVEKLLATNELPDQGILEEAISVAIDNGQLKISGSSGYSAEYRTSVLPAILRDTLVRYSGGEHK